MLKFEIACSDSMGIMFIADRFGIGSAVQIGISVLKQNQLNTDDVISMYAQMHKSSEIAKKYGVEVSVIINCLRKHGVNIRTRWDY